MLVFGRADRRDPGAGYTTVLLDPRAPGVMMTEIPMRFREGVRHFQLEFDTTVESGPRPGVESERKPPVSQSRMGGRNLTSQPDPTPPADYGR
ncbi:hypothetical protein C5E41_26825 [Nocardia nova]|nr:hypothetical protein C5E41_26825 [Nocardia nova]